MNAPELELPIGQIAAERPHSVRIFHQHRLDFCCGGGVTLREACAKRGLDPAVLLAQLATEEAQVHVPTTRWAERPVSELIDYILERHHRPLDGEFPRLEAMARKVLRVHGERDERLGKILSDFLALKEEIELHMQKEEMVLFPWILEGRNPTPKAPIEVMQHEHDDAGRLLDSLRALTDDYRVPLGACTTWKALWHGLQALDADLREHIHLENNILFPNALRA
jgi:regulator of cell morphogenesis and NO signaling